MSKLERITVTLPQEMAAKLRTAVRSGEYATSSEVVREALRAWNAEQDRKSAEDSEIRKILDRARAGGRKSPEEVFAAVFAALDDAEATPPTRRAG